MQDHLCSAVQVQQRAVYLHTVQAIKAFLRERITGSPVSTTTFIINGLTSSTTSNNSNTRVLCFLSVGRIENPPVDTASASAWRLLLEGWCQPFMSSNIKLDHCYIYSVYTHMYVSISVYLYIYIVISLSLHIYYIYTTLYLQILKRIDFTRRWAVYGLLVFIADVSQVQEPFSRGILFGPHDV